jgi:uncharacterized membrane protein YdbT with pleckstrin-like domain
MDEKDQTDIKEADLPILKERKRLLFLGLPFTFTKYLLTPKSLQLNRGLFTTTEEDLLLFRVMDISFKRTFFQKLVGLGTLTVRSSDKTNPILEVRNIKNCKFFKEALDERVEKERIRMRFRAGELMGEFNDQDQIDGQDQDLDLNDDPNPDN